MIDDWYTRPTAAGSPLEMRNRRLPTLRVFSAGDRLRVCARDPYRGTEIEGPGGERATIARPVLEASRLAHNLDDAFDLGVGLVMRLDMEEDARREIDARQRDQRRGFTRDRESDRDVVREIRNRLDNPASLVQSLGLTKGARRQAGGGLLIVCPAPNHSDRSPSCSVRVGRDGTVQVRCHGCGWSGDALSLVAVVHRLDVRRRFRAVLERAAEIAGVTLPRSEAA